MAKKVNKSEVDSSWGMITISMTDERDIPRRDLVELANWLNDPLRGGHWYTEVNRDNFTMDVYFSDPNIALEMRLRWT